MAIRMRSMCRSQTLLSTEYADARRKLIGERASMELRPGDIGDAQRAHARACSRWPARKSRSAPAAASRHSRRCRPNGATPCISMSWMRPAT